MVIREQRQKWDRAETKRHVIISGPGFFFSDRGFQPDWFIKASKLLDDCVHNANGDFCWKIFFEYRALLLSNPFSEQI